MKRKFSILLAASMIMPTVAPTFTTLYATEVATQAERVQVQGKVTLEKEGVDYPVEGATIEVYNMGKEPILTVKTDKEGNYTVSLEKYGTYQVKAQYTDPKTQKEYKYEEAYGVDNLISYLTEYNTQGKDIHFVDYKTEVKVITGTVQAVTASGKQVALDHAKIKIFEGPNRDNLKLKESKNCNTKYRIDTHSGRVYWIAIYGMDDEENGYSYEGYLENIETIKDTQNITLKPCPIMYLEANTPYVDIYVNRNGNKCFMGNPPDKGGEIVYLLGNDDDKIDLYFELDGKEIKPVSNPVANMTVKQYKEKGENNWEYFEFNIQ